MLTPGATTFGLMTPLISGPREEKSAIVSVPSTAPTVSADAAAPGEVTVPELGPELPAAMTNSVVDVEESSSTARSRGLVPSPGSPPRLMLTMAACWLTAQLIPAITCESAPVPLESRTLPISREAPGATPL